MARAVAADLGLGAGWPPVWRRDNPFWDRAVRADARRYSLAGRLLLTTLTLAALLVGGLALHTAYPRPFRFFLSASPLPWTAWLFIVVSFFHTLLILGTRAAFATSISLEAQRQTLPGLLLSPLRRAEMLWAMAVPPAAAALIAALAGLPVYLLLREFGGCEWRDVWLLYAVFALLAFDPPAYVRPALGPDPPPVVMNARAAQPRRGGSALSTVPLFVFLAWTLGNWVRGMGGWGFHLLSVLPPPTQSLVIIFFAWPYCAALLLAAPLPFFAGHLPPWVYLVPFLAAGWVASALHTGAALSAGDLPEMLRLPLHRRARTLSRWTTRLGWFCALGFVWQPWVLGGDTGRLLGVAVPGLAENLAGLLLLLGSAAIVLAASATERTVAVRKDARTLRPLPRLLRRVVRRALRPLRLALLTFALACLCGGASPFAPPAYAVLGRLALVTLAVVVCAAGYEGLKDRLVAQTDNPRVTHYLLAVFPLLALALLFGIPFLALSLPRPFPSLAALSPAMAWLELFPGSDTLLHAFPFWPLGPLPPFTLAVAAPAVLGGILLGLAYRPARAQAVPTAAPSKRPPIATAARPVRHAQRTAALMAWVTARTDNPLFTYEMRTRTRSGRWVDRLRTAGALLLLGIGAAAQYPKTVEIFSSFAVLGFFQHGGPFSPAPPSVPQAYADLAALLLSVELYVFAFRGQMVGEALFWKDQERGTLGFLLMTPLTAGQIFWGKVWGQASGYVAAWAVCGAAGLLLYGLASREFGLGPTLTAWAISQLFIAATFILGLALGAATATHTLRFRVLRGLSTLLLVLAYGGGFRLIMWQDLVTTPADLSALLARHLMLGSLYGLALAVPAFAYARWRVAALRRGDIAYDAVSG